MCLVPLGRQRLGGMGEGLAGHVGAVGGFEDEEAHVVDDEVAPLRTAQGGPADQGVAGLEEVSASAPLKDGDRDVVLVDDLREGAPGRLARP